MDINFNNIGIKNGMVDMNGMGAERIMSDKTEDSLATANLTIDNHIDGVSSGEPVAEVPDSALARDDKLGMLVSAAFNQSPPPMPDFR